MHWIDWFVMIATVAGIVIYGVLKTRNIGSVQRYLLGDKDLHWWTIGLSVMATQASAITFLSTPGQAYLDGMGFAQFYFGMPVAMVLLCIFVLPIYYKLNIYTAYEYLEGRFDLRTRTLTAVLFLIQRGLAAGITIYAPAIILSTILGWPLFWTIIIIGGIVIFYTMSGGTKAVSVTQKQQMIVILGGMFTAAVYLVYQFPEGVGLSDALNVAGKMGKLEVVDFTFDLDNRYTFWTGMLGGVFLFLSYFGTDQSQVQRYLSGRSLTESRLGLLFNGIIKVPMQFLVLFTGVLVFVFFQFYQPPVHFNTANVEVVRQSNYAEDFVALEREHTAIFTEKQGLINELIEEMRTEDPASDAKVLQVQEMIARDNAIQQRADELIVLAGAESGIELETEDADYVFITFIIKYLPIGLVGLLLAVIFSAAMSSTASELNALATTTVIDLYRRSLHKHDTDRHYLLMSKVFTVVWGLIALAFAMGASLFDNLIEAVNIVGSIFYGVILGIFVVAFFFKWIQGPAVVIAAILIEIVIITIFTLDYYGIIHFAYLWLNLVGCVLTVLVAMLLQQLLPNGTAQEATLI